eukprot:1159310-Pelagomonas_calceolata.AAC.4
MEDFIGADDFLSIKDDPEALAVGVPSSDLDPGDLQGHGHGLQFGLGGGQVLQGTLHSLLWEVNRLSLTQDVCKPITSEGMTD